LKLDEFINDAQNQLSSLSQWLVEIESEITIENQKIAELQQRRQNLMDNIASRLLPDLTQSSIASLEAHFPDLITNNWVRQEIEQRRQQIKQRLKEIAHSYEPNKYESQIEKMDVEIGKLESDFNDIEPGYKAMASIKGIEDLIKRAYGTDYYQLGWLNPQYYRDWKRADEIVEELKCSDWNDVVRRYENIRNGYEAAKQQLIQAQEGKENLKGLRDEHMNLLNALDNVEAAVLDSCHLRIKSELDLSADKSDPMMKPIADIDAKIQESTDRINGSLQDRREKVHSQMVSLQQIIATAAKSGRQEVPDDYAVVYGGNRGSRPYQVNVYNSSWGSAPGWYYDDWIVPVETHHTVLNFFSTNRAGYGGYHHGPSYYSSSDVTESHYGYVS